MQSSEAAKLAAAAKAIALSYFKQRYQMPTWKILKSKLISIKTTKPPARCFSKKRMAPHKASLVQGVSISPKL